MPFKNWNIFIVIFLRLTGNLIKKWNRISLPESDPQLNRVNLLFISLFLLAFPLFIRRHFGVDFQHGYLATFSQIPRFN